MTFSLIITYETFLSQRKNNEYTFNRINIFDLDKKDKDRIIR